MQSSVATRTTLTCYRISERCDLKGFILNGIAIVFVGEEEGFNMMLYVLLGMFLGFAIAWLINRFLADKVENKDTKISLKVAAYIVLIILGLFLGVVSSIKPSLDRYIDGKINALEITLNRYFPDKKVMELGVSASDFSEVIDKLRQSIGEINIDSDGIFEKYILKGFVDKVNIYIDEINRGVNTAGISIGNKQGEITLRAVFFHLKTLALRKITPYIRFFIILIIICMLIFIAIYISVVSASRKRATSNAGSTR